MCQHSPYILINSDDLIRIILMCTGCFNFTWFIALKTDLDNAVHSDCLCCCHASHLFSYPTCISRSGALFLSLTVMTICFTSVALPSDAVMVTMCVPASS